MIDIKINNVSVYYGSECILDNINLNIRNKEFLGIIGPNGGGKTTLLKLLLGIVKPTKGSVKVRQGCTIGYVPQFTSFDKGFPIKVMDVVLMGLTPQKLHLFHKFSGKDVSLAEKIMKELDIFEYKDRQIGQLSGGQLQKVLIARALINKPDILLLDEPTASIDANSKTEIYHLLNTLKKDMTIVIVSHDIGVIFSYIDSIACLNKTLYYHGNDPKLNHNTLEKIYGCPVELVAHWDTPHRVFRPHEEVKK